MAHTVEKRWSSKRRPDGSVQEGVNQQVGQRAERVLQAVQDGEELYQQLTEMVAFAGGTMQDVANQLFADEIAARGDVMANAQETAMVQDAAAAATSLHELYEATNNVAVAAEDRASKLRRMI